ncbi:hypothetical protein [Sphingomonas sp. YL-JM2C]
MRAATVDAVGRLASIVVSDLIERVSQGQGCTGGVISINPARGDHVATFLGRRRSYQQADWDSHMHIGEIAVILLVSQNLEQVGQGVPCPLGRRFHLGLIARRNGCLELLR